MLQSMGLQRVGHDLATEHTTHKIKISQKRWDSVSILLLLLLSRFSRVRLCVTPEMAAHQAPPSLGFSRQEHWSGLPFPSPTHESGKWKWSRSVVSNSQQPHGLQPTRLLHPWDFPGNSTGVGCHCLLYLVIKRQCLCLGCFLLGHLFWGKPVVLRSGLEQPSTGSFQLPPEWASKQGLHHRNPETPAVPANALDCY